jgi:F1F0 ATPase subunit 2
MSEMTQMTMALFAGLLLGAMFYGGLWWTVRKGLASPSPALWFIGSLLLRTCITLTGFYAVAGNDWKRLLACLLGFIMARIIVTRLTALPPAKETSHAP